MNQRNLATEEVVACPEQVCMFARAGDGLFGVAELQEDT